MSTTESAVSGVTKGIAPYLLLAGILGVLYLKRDAIAKWISDTIASPVSGAISDTWGVVTSPFVSAGQTAGRWWYETTNPAYKEAMADQAYFESLLASPHANVANEIVASKAADEWVDAGLFGLSFTVLGQTQHAGGSIVDTEATDPAITYTSEEMSTMSKGKTQDPGAGYRVRGQSITGATLYEVGPWTKVGEVTVLDPSGAFSMEIWKNPIDGELTVRDGFGGQLSWSNFQRIERQYGRAYEATWL